MTPMPESYFPSTDSMEEADALADRVGVLDKRLLATGTTSELLARFHVYELQFSCHSTDEVVQVRYLMAERMPQWQMIDLMALKYEYEHNGSEAHNPYADLLDEVTACLKEQFQDYIPSFALRKISLENAFFRIVERGHHHVV
ncbi:hypothetical protein FRC03_012764 [Tulasnella sp. 419]|nr:hypothetical protein FRC03_012764 [Tulasnella sp. 419]